MQCGAKCFLVEMKVSGEKQTTTVIARTPIAARKTLRKQLPEVAEIISVRRKK